MKRLLVVLACSVLATPFAMAQDGGSPASPIPQNLSQFQDVRSAIPLGTMQSWIIMDGARQRVAVTTADGFTFVGEVYGPGGQDISTALLAISELATPASQPVVASQASADKAPLPPTVAPPAQIASSPASITTAAPSASSVPPPALTMVKAQSLDELFQQATDASVWFSAGTPKPGAPAIYFIADPTCPHCAVAVDMLAQKVKAGDIDLRVILAPIRSQQAVYEAASMLQSPNVAADFMSHELSKTTSTPSTLKVLAPNDINPDVVRGLQHNVEWIRANGVEGVPFWIFDTAEGAQIAFGEVRDTMLAKALPARGSVQAAAQVVRP